MNTDLYQKIKCPVCGKYEFNDLNDFDICPVCGWENDVIQLEDPDYDGGANHISLNEARMIYKKISKLKS